MIKGNLQWRLLRLHHSQTQHRTFANCARLNPPRLESVRTFNDTTGHDVLRDLSDGGAALLFRDGQRAHGPLQRINCVTLSYSFGADGLTHNAQISVVPASASTRRHASHGILTGADHGPGDSVVGRWSTRS